MAAMRQPSAGDGYIKLLAWTLLVCCWLVQGLAARHSMDADGVSYQNIADAALGGDWRSFLNGYWSPGFPFLLTLWRGLFHPTPYGVPMTARFLQIAGLVLAIFTFEYFLKVFLRVREQLAQADGKCWTLSNRSICILSYATFLWISVFLIPASLNPVPSRLSALYRHRWECKKRMDGIWLVGPYAWACIPSESSDVPSEF